MRISERLQTVAHLVSEGGRLADIGTDHGYVPIYLVKEGRIPSAIAMDVRTGPLLRAAEHVAEYGLTDRIETRLSDGLEKLSPGEADSVLIAGMGGPLTVRIMTAGEVHWDAVSEWILQPQSEIEEVRTFLADHGFVIVSEDMVFEEGKYYPMMRVLRGRMEPLSEAEALFGPCLLRDRHPILHAFLEKEQAKTGLLLERLAGQGSEHASARAQELKAYRELVAKVLSDWI